MKYVVIKTLDGETLKLNNAYVLAFFEPSSELRCVTNKGETITFDLHQLSEIGFVIQLDNELDLVVGSAKAQREKEEK